MRSSKNPSTSQQLNPSTAAARPDPYATRGHKTIDVLLLLLTALTMFIVFHSAMKERAKRVTNTTAPSAQTQPDQLVKR